MFKNVQVVLTGLITHAGLIFFMYPTDLIECAHQAHWLPILIGFAFHFLSIFVYLKGLSYFGLRRSIIEILACRSKLLAWTLLLPICLYIFVFDVEAVRAYSEIISMVFLSNTPLWILMLLLLVIPAFMVLNGGVLTILRIGLLFTFLFAVPFLFVLAASFKNIDWRYALPLIPRGGGTFSFLGHPSYYKSFFAFVGGFLFLGFIPPHIQIRPKTIYIGSLVLLPLFLLSVYVPIMTLGEETARQLQFPFIFTADTVDITWLMFDRVTTFLLLSLMAFFFMFIAMGLWQMTIIIQTVKNVRPLIVVSCLVAVVFIFCMMIPDWGEVEMIFQINSFLRGYVAVATPAVIFILGRRHLKQTSGS